MLGLILLLPIGFVAWICLFRDTPLEISKETTYITEPLTADGKRVDYFRALEQEFYPPNMKTDDNGYRMIVQTLGPMIDSSTPDAEILAQQVYEKLGLDPNLKPTMIYEEPYSFLRRHQISENNEEETAAEDLDDLDLSPMSNEEREAFEELDDKSHRPWTLEELPMMEKWLKQNGPVLDMIGKAVRKPEFCRSLTRSENTQDLFAAILSDVHIYRGFARGLSARANYRIGTGDIDGAIDDIISCHALGRHASKQGSLIDALIGIASEGIAKSIGIAGSLEHQPTEAQLQRFVKELRNLPPPTVMDTEIFERYYALDALQKVITTEERKNIDAIFENVFFYEPKGLERIAIKSTKVLGFNWNVVMSRLNSHYDSCYDDPNEFYKLQDRLNAPNRPFYATLNALLPTSRSEILADRIAVQLLNGICGKEALRRLQCSNNIQLITLAMLLYEKQHGQLPPAYTVDDNDKPLHSWRVLLLPYLGEEAQKLYDKIRLDEPWDSEHNQQFHDATVAFYQCPTAKLKPGQTRYSVVVGKKTAFQAGEGKKLDQFGPESSNMLLVLEGPNPACWMDPTSDLTELSAEKALDNNTGHPGIILVGQRSGSVSPISEGLSRETFQQGLEGTNAHWLDW